MPLLTNRSLNEYRESTPGKPGAMWGIGSPALYDTHGKPGAVCGSWATIQSRDGDAGYSCYLDNLYDLAAGGFSGTLVSDV
jgi:hypothetical protein